jgi:hypothetical protein
MVVSVEVGGGVAEKQSTMLTNVSKLS